MVLRVAGAAGWTQSTLPAACSLRGVEANPETLPLSWTRPATAGSCSFTVQLPAVVIHRIMLQRGSVQLSPDPGPPLVVQAN
jgi:hypothetical protein